MIANKTKFKKKLLKQSIPYALVFFAIIGLAFVGSQDKKNDGNKVPIMLAISDNNYDVSVDQISELYMVAEIAQNVNLESKNYLSMDYASAVAQYSMNQTSTTTSTLEKPNLVDTSNLSRGVITYTVSEGETMEIISEKTGISTDEIRWSNGLKTTDVEPGQTLYIPSVSGIVYTVKNDDSIESIVEKYGSSVELIIAYNDLESTGTVTEGQRIVLPDGTLPETERPEYVPPKPAYSGYSSTIHWGGGGNPMPYGWCTWFAWQWRHDNMGDDYTLPSGLGNARYWDGQLAGSFYIDGNPQYGDVFVSKGGYYGHVGIVTGVNDDGSITITDMNGPQGWGRVATRDIEAGEWHSYNFVHGRK